MPRKASSSRASKIARTDEAEDVTQSAGAKLPPSPTHAAAGAGGKGKGGGKKGKAAVEESSAAAAEAHPSHAHGHRGGSAAALEAKSASSSSSSSALAAIPPAPIKAVVYTLKHPKADTMGEYRKEAAKRYNGEGSACAPVSATRRVAPRRPSTTAPTCTCLRATLQCPPRT